ncbi:MAG: PQQ-binding-like beta-propeller repeat protein [Propionibacteriales bacterium]|nr:PQQ-binding-like beta-propeller repeat protein [Propionibacteriales bacterium]
MAVPARSHGPSNQTTRRSGWVPTVLIAGALGLVLVWLTGVAALTGVGLGDPSVPVRRFAPADAGVTSVQWDPGVGGPRTGEVEQARFVGSVVLSAVPQPFLVRTEPVREPDLSSTRWWRESVRDSSGETPRVRLRSVTEGGIRMHGQSWGANGVTFSPTLIELTANPRPGDEWRSSGTVARNADSPPGTYEHRAAAQEPADPQLSSRGCLEVSQQTVMTQVGGPDVDWVEINTWCPGGGVVAQTGRFGDITYSMTEQSASPGPVETRSRPAEAATVATWQHGPFETYAGDASFGRERYQPLTMGAPAVTNAAGVYSRSVASDDVTGSRNVRSGQGTARFWLDWWGRPGGTVLQVAALGDLVLASTTDRTVVAYAGGVRRWTLTVDDVVLAAPVWVGPDRAAIVTLAGTVELVDLQDGRVVWTAQTEGGVTMAPVTDGRTIVTYDNDGNLSGWDAATGTEVFTAEAFRKNPERLALAGGRVLAQHLSDIDAYDIADGTRVWTRPMDRNAVLAAAGDQVVVAGPDGTTALDAGTMRVLWQAPPARAVIAIAGGWAFLGAESVTVRSPEGAELRAWDVSVEGRDPVLLSEAGRLWMFSIAGDVELAGQWFGAEQ